MGIVWQLVRMSLVEEYQNKFALIFGRVMAFVLTVLFAMVWDRLTVSGSFASFSRDEFLTYIVLVHIMRPFVFLFKYRVMSDEIVNGTFSLVLTLPVSTPWYYYLRSWGERLIGFSSAVVEAFIILSLFHFHFVVPTIDHLLWFGVFFVMGHILSEIGSFFMHTVSFWTTQANGPRFLYDWIAEFMGGLFFPLWILAPLSSLLFLLAPFSLFLYRPILVYLRGGETVSMLLLFGLALAWIVCGLVAVRFLYRRGLAQYNAEGI